MFTGTMAGNFEFVSGRLVQLAEAIPEELFTWRPAEGVRSTSETIMHVAGANLGLPMMLGVAPPEGMEMSEDMMAKMQEREKNVTAKAEVIADLEKSIAYGKSAIGDFPAANLGDEVEFFGMKMTKGGVTADPSQSLPRAPGPADSLRPKQRCCAALERAEARVTRVQGGGTMRSLGVALVMTVAWSPAVAGGDTFTVTSTADSGAGTLRQAIIDANANPGEDRIEFAIPEGECSAAGVCTIDLLTFPEAIDEAVVVDGTTQPRYGTAPANVCATETAPSYMRVEILGDPLGFFSRHTFLVVSTDPSIVRGLALSRGYPIGLKSSGAHRVQCTHIGVSANGFTRVSTSSGIVIDQGGNGAIIGVDGDGVDDLAERNVIAAGIGVYINGNRNNVVAGNYFGLGADGVTSLGSSLGVYIRQGSSNNLVGTNEDDVSDDLERNVIGNCALGSISIRVPVVGMGTSSSGIGSGWMPQVPWRQTRPRSGSRKAASITRFATTRFGGAVSASRSKRMRRWVPCRPAIVWKTTSMVSFTRARVWRPSKTTGGEPRTVPSGDGAGSGDSVAVAGTGSLDFDPWLAAVPPPMRDLLRRLRVWRHLGLVEYDALVGLG